MERDTAESNDASRLYFALYTENHPCYSCSINSKMILNDSFTFSKNDNKTILGKQGVA